MSRVFPQLKTLEEAPVENVTANSERPAVEKSGDANASNAARRQEQIVGNAREARPREGESNATGIGEVAAKATAPERTLGARPNEPWRIPRQPTNQALTKLAPLRSHNRKTRQTLGPA